MSQAEVPLDAWLPGARTVQTVFLWAAKAVIERHECAAMFCASIVVIFIFFFQL
jgi:hypothetical protein